MAEKDVGTLRKQDAMKAASDKLLPQICGQGDFLCSQRRCMVVRETFRCLNSRPGCPEANGMKEDPLVELARAEGKAQDSANIGILVYSIANQQHLINQEWYNKAADFLWQLLVAADEVPMVARELQGKELKDEKYIRLCELVDVVAASAGIRGYHRAMGIPMPELPKAEEDLKPLFSRVTDVCSSGLHWDTELAWGPRFEGKDVNLERCKTLGVNFTPNAPGDPNSKWEPALTTGYNWKQWSFVAYPPNQCITQLKPFKGSKISRADMESIASAYTTAIHCAF